ncbi:hypothetical protein GUJ93_ZPchr0003g16631 [Zizania palustris]|uniref:Uncharacterized protein n=1 Tax=Zizania palustris TaxID=103762 RepID=A0A8J5STW3_ZIZPA|nr:hypothetical protein GUJ93_ZPchr0003g16631 [Zizania palustris]
MARSVRDGFRATAGFCCACDKGCRSVISGRGVRGVAGGRRVDAPMPSLPGVRGEAEMAHCGVDGVAGAMARRLGVLLAVGERSGVALDRGLDGVVCDMPSRKPNSRAGRRARQMVLDCYIPVRHDGLHDLLQFAEVDRFTNIICRT